jgi:hypothetical protein
MEPQPDFESMKEEFDSRFPQRTFRDVIRAMLEGASRAFVWYPPERRPRLSRERYEEILKEFDAIDAQSPSIPDQGSLDQMAQQAKPIEKEE